jgi:hypothetical protein
MVNGGTRGDRRSSVLPTDAEEGFVRVGRAADYQAALKLLVGAPTEIR